MKSAECSTAIVSAEEQKAIQERRNIFSLAAHIHVYLIHSIPLISTGPLRNFCLLCLLEVSLSSLTVDQGEYAQEADDELGVSSAEVSRMMMGKWVRKGINLDDRMIMS